MPVKFSPQLHDIGFYPLAAFPDLSVPAEKLIAGKTNRGRILNIQVSSMIDLEPDGILNI